MASAAPSRPVAQPARGPKQQLMGGHLVPRRADTGLGFVQEAPCAGHAAVLSPHHLCPPSRQPSQAGPTTYCPRLQIQK